MRLALIGDIHAFSLKVHPRRLLSRRIMGQGNLWLNRRFRFNHAMLDPVFDRVRELKPDKVLFSGDVTTTSLEDEFLDVVKYLRPLAKDHEVVLVPGNHDRYTFRAKHDRRIETLLEGIMPGEWPHFEELTPNWRLLALDSAMPQWVMSRGRLGPTQMQGLVEHTRHLGRNDGLLVLCHYPVATPGGIPNSWAHALAEERDVRRLLSDCPARVVFLHGHIHKPWHWGVDDIEEPEQSAPVYHHNGRKSAPFTCINAGSPCMTSSAYPLGQGFWQIELPDHPSKALKLIHHVPLPTDTAAHRDLPRKQRQRTVPTDLRWDARVIL